MNKREKAETLRGEIEQNVKQREQSLIKIRGLLQQQRDKNQQIVRSLVTESLNNKHKSVEASKELLVLEFANDHDGHNMKKWSKWVQVKIQFLSDQCEYKRQECARLEKIIDGYQKNMRLSVNGINEAEENGQHVDGSTVKPMMHGCET